MKTVLAIQHSPHEGLGNLEHALHNAGFNIHYRYVWQESLTDIDPLEPSLLVVLGGLMGVYEQEKYPFLTSEINLLKQRLAHDLPTLGICLGSQLMAAALGGKVYPGPLKEIGWSGISLTPAGNESCLTHFKHIPVLHWHGDTFDLPAGATLLASSQLYQHQGFSIGKNGLALQFHPEVTAAGLVSWFKDDITETAQNPKLNWAALKHETTLNIGNLEKQAQQCWQAWLEKLNV